MIRMTFDECMMQNTKTYYIYELMNPLDGSIYYVGSTDSPKTREVNHNVRALCGNKRKDAVLREIHRNGKRPVFRILEETDVYNTPEREYYWIWRKLAEGCPLVNSHLTRLPGRMPWYCERRENRKYHDLYRDTQMYYRKNSEAIKARAIAQLVIDVPLADYLLLKLNGGSPDAPN